MNLGYGGNGGRAVCKHCADRRRRLGVGVLLKIIPVWLLVVLLGGVPYARAAASLREDDVDMIRTTLNNGLRLVIVRHPVAPVVTTVVNYLVGANEVPVGFPGTARVTGGVISAT